MKSGEEYPDGFLGPGAPDRNQTGTTTCADASALSDDAVRTTTGGKMPNSGGGRVP